MVCDYTTTSLREEGDKIDVLWASKPSLPRVIIHDGALCGRRQVPSILQVSQRADGRFRPMSRREAIIHPPTSLKIEGTRVIRRKRAVMNDDLNSPRNQPATVPLNPDRLRPPCCTTTARWKQERLLYNATAKQQTRTYVL